MKYNMIIFISTIDFIYSTFDHFLNRIYFLKDLSFHALVDLQDPFDNLCCVERISM